MKFPNFHVSVTVVTQLIGTALQIFSALSSMVPVNDKVTVAAIIAAASGRTSGFSPPKH